MTLRWLLAALHLVALGIGLGAIWARASALRALPDPAALRRTFQADAWWGVAALVWLLTGLPRLFYGTEKVLQFYTINDLFWVKMGLFVAILALEAWPMVTLIRWRMQSAARESLDTSRARLFARISVIQAVLLILMVIAATGTARGIS